MKELDVTKPMQAEGDYDHFKVDYLRSLSAPKDSHRITVNRHLLLLTDRTGYEFSLEVDTSGCGITDNINIINVPEKTFNWDKPIRYKEVFGNAICILKRKRDNEIYPWKLLLLEPNSNFYTETFTEDGRTNVNGSIFLENYEPEERYYISNYIGIKEGTQVIDKSNGFVIAEFYFDSQKEDAELFKKVKEQGL